VPARADKDGTTDGVVELEADVDMGAARFPRPGGESRKAGRWNRSEDPRNDGDIDPRGFWQARDLAGFLHDPARLVAEELAGKLSKDDWSHTGPNSGGTSPRNRLEGFPCVESVEGHQLDNAEISHGEVLHCLKRNQAFVTLGRCDLTRKYCRNTEQMPNGEAVTDVGQGNQGEVRPRAGFRLLRGAVWGVPAQNLGDRLGSLFD
jgi:hypothetical protein